LLRKKYFDELRCPNNFTKVLADFRHYSFSEQMRLPSLIKKSNPDLVHFPHFNVPVFYKEKFVVTIHDLVMHWQKGVDATTLNIPTYFTKRLAYKTVFRKAIVNSAKIIVPSNAVKREVIDYYKIDPGKISVVHEGVHQIKAKKINSDNLLKKYKLSLPYFIYTGNAYPHKNLERVIRAVVQLNKLSSISLAIVSSRGIFTSRLEKIIRNNNAQEFVDLLGFVPDDELSILYQNSIAFVYPSLYEGFGLPGLEAISSGAISLVSDIAVFKEIYQDSALYFDPYRVDSIAGTMKKVLELDASQKKKMIVKSQEFIKRYSWTKMAKETLRVYQSARA